MSPGKEEITTFFKDIQDEICEALEAADGKAAFTEDSWKREEGGGGRSRILQDGKVIEKGGVNFSAVHGELPDKIMQALVVPDNRFYATGISIVMHPFNPFVPIIHMNLRYFELQDGTRWFGGGIDLTPHYINKEEAEYFHLQLKKICDSFNSSYYPGFKKLADDYFFIPHRNESRGIGGIFFDRLSPDEKKFENIFDLVKQLGKAFAPLYISLIDKNKDKPFTEENKRWQLIRRGRYVEFNLVYDKGTKFGLDTNGRIESIFMSLPPYASWPYNFTPEKGSDEEATLEYLKKR